MGLVGGMGSLTAPLTFADGKSVEMVESAKDLEVFIDSSFKPSLPCKEAYDRARATFFRIRRGFAILTPAIFLLLNVAMGRSHLDFAVQAFALISTRISS